MSFATSGGFPFIISAYIVGSPGVGKHGSKSKASIPKPQREDCIAEAHSLFKKDKDSWRFDLTLMESDAEFVIDGVRYVVELDVKGDSLPGDSFVQQDVERLGGPYIIHSAPILAYCVASRESYDHALDLYHRIKEIRKDSEHAMPILLAACQIDRPDREVPSKDAEAWAAQHSDVCFAETSAETGEGIEEALEKLVRLFHKYRSEGVYVQ